MLFPLRPRKRESSPRLIEAADARGKKKGVLPSACSVSGALGPPVTAETRQAALVSSEYRTSLWMEIYGTFSHHYEAQACHTFTPKLALNTLSTAHPLLMLMFSTIEGVHTPGDDSSVWKDVAELFLYATGCRRVENRLGKSITQQRWGVSLVCYGVVVSVSAQVKEYFSFFFKISRVLVYCSRY